MSQEFTLSWHKDALETAVTGAYCEETVMKVATDLALHTGNAAGMVFVAAMIRGPDRKTVTNKTESKDKKTKKIVLDDRHITANFKTAEHEQAGQYIPCHIYLNGARPDYSIKRIKWFKVLNEV